MSVFFDVCVRCKKTFTNEKDFYEHMKSHERGFSSGRKAMDEIEEQLKIEAQTVPGISNGPDDDTQLSAVRQVNAKRKKLIAAGVEAATMTLKEVESRYADEKKKGTVK